MKQWEWWKSYYLLHFIKYAPLDSSATLFPIMAKSGFAARPCPFFIPQNRITADEGSRMIETRGQKKANRNKEVQDDEKKKVREGEKKNMHNYRKGKRKRWGRGEQNHHFWKVTCLLEYQPDNENLQDLYCVHSWLASSILIANNAAKKQPFQGQEREDDIIF